MIRNAAQQYPRDLGVMATSTKVLLYSNLSGRFGNRFHVGASVDGLSFKDFRKTPSVIDDKGVPEEMVYTRDFRISSFGKEHILLYKTLTGGPHLSAATSKDAVAWKKTGTIHSLHDMSMLIPN